MAATPAFAQADFYSNNAPPTWDINVGAAGAMRPTYAGSDRYRAIAVPLFQIRYRDAVSLSYDGLSVYWHTGDLRLGVGVSYDGGRLDHQTSSVFNSGDNRLNGLGDVDSSIAPRAFISYQFGAFYTDVSVTKYIGPDNKGVVVSGGVSTPLTFGSWILRPYARAVWADDNYMRVLFGVTPLQASHSIFPAFNAASGVEDLSGGMTLIYRFDENWFAALDANVVQYLGDAASSPITLSNTNTQVTAGIGYHF